MIARRASVCAFKPLGGLWTHGGGLVGATSVTVLLGLIFRSSQSLMLWLLLLNARRTQARRARATGTGRVNVLPVSVLTGRLHRAFKLDLTLHQFIIHGKILLVGTEGRVMAGKNGKRPKARINCHARNKRNPEQQAVAGIECDSFSLSFTFPEPTRRRSGSWASAGRT